jgi:hypothetical protein
MAVFPLHAHDGSRPRAPVHPLAGVCAGLIAGIAYLAAQTLLSGQVSGDMSLPLRRICAILLGEDVLSGGDFGVELGGIGLLVHFAVSIVYGRFVDVAVRDAPLLKATVIGGAVGLAMYLVVFELLAQFVFPWFRSSPVGITAVDHILFGVICGAVYCLLRPRLPMLQEGHP